MKAQIFNHSAWIKETDPEKLNRVFDAMLAQSGHSIINFVQHHWQPQGYTCLYLLGESHFAVHTWPEQGLTYVELSSCNLTYFVRFIELLTEYQHTTSQHS